MTRVLVHPPGGSPREESLGTDRIVVGRSHECDLCFRDDASLSRRHFSLERHGDGWFVLDLGSKNGTRVNGAALRARTRLAPGDRVEAGQVVVVFEPGHPGTESVRFYPGEEPGPDRTIVAELDGVLHEVSSQPDLPSTGGGPSPLPLESTAVRALIQAGRELSGRRPLGELFPLILTLSMEAVGAERGAVLILEDGELRSQAVRGESLLISSSVRDKVLQEKKSILVADLLEHDLKNQMSLVGQQIRSVMAVPLQAEDRVIGMIYVDNRDVVRPFTPHDLNLLTVLGNVAAIRIEHERLIEIEQAERLMERDLRQAAEIQRGLLPTGAPGVAGLELAGHNAPSRGVGGDYYDFLPGEDGSVTLVLGDVCGKGMAAAMMMSALQARVHLLTETGGDLGTFLARLNRSLAARCPANRFVSLFVATIDPGTGAMTSCSAGHNPPLLRRAGGAIEVIQGGGPVLGILPDAAFTPVRHTLEPGDVLLIYSDGLTEAADDAGREFGTERLSQILATCADSPPAAIVARVLAEVGRWTAGTPLADDLTLVVARRA